MISLLDHVPEIRMLFDEINFIFQLSFGHDVDQLNSHTKQQSNTNQGSQETERLGNKRPGRKNLFKFLIAFPFFFVLNSFFFLVLYHYRGYRHPFPFFLCSFSKTMATYRRGSFTLAFTFDAVVCSIVLIASS